MSPLFEAALDLQAFCREQDWEFCFIGGIVVQRWGVVRYTKDADITLLTRFVNDEAFATALVNRWESRVRDPIEFATQARVVLLRHENGVELDIALGGFDFEERSVQRASAWRNSEGAELVTCSAEDLIVHKAFAGREDKDWPDIDGIVAMQLQKLDLVQIRRELSPLALLREDDEMIPRLERLFKRYKLR